MNISNRQWFLAGVFIFSMLNSRSIWANSKVLNMQGTLTDSSGNPLTGNQTVTFRLYTSSTAAVASAFWTESLTITLSSGLFNVSLGNVTSLDSSAFNQPYYLGIQVAGDANELSPRQPLGASAYAQGSLGDFNVGNNLVVSSSITAATASLNTLTVSTITTSGNVGIATSNPQTALDVNGSAQFGSGATKSTFTAAGLLNLTSSGIRWADGSVSTTASSGGGACTNCFILNSSQTVSGANNLTGVNLHAGILGLGYSSFTWIVATGTWTNPVAPNPIYVQCWGGGNPGSNNSAQTYAGGAAGGYAAWIATNSASSYAVVIATGGSIGASGNPGLGSFPGDTSFGPILCRHGGANRLGTGFPDYPGGTCTGGAINLMGGQGEGAAVGGSYGGSGGSAPFGGYGATRGIYTWSGPGPAGFPGGGGGGSSANGTIATVGANGACLVWY